MRHLAIILALGLLPGRAAAQGILEIPQDGLVLTGIGAISGWKCEAGTITIRFDDGPPITVPYGTSREDTRFICADPHSGFALQWNYNLLTEGEHRADVFDDGDLFASASFTVTKLGAEFLRGVAASCTVEDFPFPGEQVTLQWQEVTQNFTIAEWAGDCRENTDCAEGEFCAKATGDCLSQGRCQPRLVGCDLFGTPVCGCDGQTYETFCYAWGHGVNVALLGMTCDGEPYVRDRFPQ